MAYGQYEGKTIDNPELRKLFDRDYVVNSTWYNDRLKHKQQKAVEFCQFQIDYINKFCQEKTNDQLVDILNIKEKLLNLNNRLKYLQSQQYFNDLVGTIGLDPLFKR